MFRDKFNKKHKQKHLKPGVIVGGVPKQSISGQHKKLAIVGIVIIVLLGGLFAYRFIEGRNRVDVQAQDQQFRQVIAESENLMLDQKYDESHKVLEDYLATGPPQKYLTSVYSSQGTIYINSQRLPEAEKAFLKAKETASEEEKYGTLLGLAKVQQILGNKDAAIKNYQEAIDALEPINPRDGNTMSNKLWVDAQIKSLKGQQ